MQQPLDSIHGHRDHRRATRLEGDRLARHLHTLTIDRFEEIARGDRYMVDHPQFQGLFCRRRSCLANGGLRPLRRRLSPPLRQILDQRNQDVGSLLLKRLGKLFSLSAHRARRPDGGLRRHRGQLGRQHDEGSRRGGLRPRGRYIDHNGDSRHGHALHNALHGAHLAARSVQLDDQHLCPIGLGLGDSPLDVARHDGCDGSLHGEHLHHGPRLGPQRRPQ